MRLAAQGAPPPPPRASQPPPPPPRGRRARHDILAAAVGLLQPGQPLGMLNGCRGSDWDRVWVLSPRETDAVQRGSKNGSRHWESAVQRSSTAQRVAIKTAHAMDLLLAYAVGLRRPRDAPGGGCLPVAQGWTGVAELVAHLVHAYTTTLFGHSKAAALMEMILGCELPPKTQERAEAKFPPAFQRRGLDAERRLLQPGTAVNDLKYVIYYQRSIHHSR
jgi:hypothetical protein